MTPSMDQATDEVRATMVWSDSSLNHAFLHEALRNVSTPSAMWSGSRKGLVAANVPLGALTPPPGPVMLPQEQKRKQSPFSVWSYMKLNASHCLRNRLARCHSSPNPSVHSLAINARCEKYTQLPGNKISICLTVNPTQVLLSERKLTEVSHLKDWRVHFSAPSFPTRDWNADSNSRAGTTTWICKLET